MKLKYYLRGLGIGIIVTTLILMIAFVGHKEKLSDEEIIKRAQALGMIMENSTEDINDTEEIETESEIADASQKEEPQSETPVADQSNANVQTLPEANPNAQPEVADQNAAPVAPAEPVKYSVTIKSGDSSDTVAMNLAKAGIIDNAADFNSYMVKNGYDDRLRTGTYSIQAGASYAEVMKVLLP